jgi:VanW like protein
MFSFNRTTGERNAAKGFLEAPVIVNGELTTGLGGGVCQVSTTVFNAAFDAGLKITERTNHALYISHYPQGRDATVDYPGVDLKFVNDTGSWLLLRTFVSSSSLTVNLYGTPVHRKVVSSATPLVAHGVPPLKKTVDERDARRLHGRRQAPVPRCLVLVVPRRAEAGAHRAAEAQARQEAAGYTDDEAAGYNDDDPDGAGSTRAIASRSHSGTRVGRNVWASTQAWRVQPSATTVPSSRMIAYS